VKGRLAIVPQCNGGYGNASLQDLPPELSEYVRKREPDFTNSQTLSKKLIISMGKHKKSG